MKRSSDNYYDEYNMNDIRIISSIGLTDDDLQVIAKAQGVRQYMVPTAKMCSSIMMIKSQLRMF